MKSFKKSILAFLALLPGIAQAKYEIDLDSEAKSRIVRLNPGQRFKFIAQGKPVILDYSKLRERLGLEDHENFNQTIGVRIHEEDSAIDLGVFDEFITTIPFESIENAPPNVRGL